MLDVAIPMTVGAVIGYVTNWLAIKMLFWPHEPVLVFGRQLPFTPGLFIRRRRDFSTSISQMAQARFANAEDLCASARDAERQGLVDRFLDQMGPVFKLAFNLYVARTNEDQFMEDCRRLSSTLGSGGVIAHMIRDKIDAMPSAEIEAMIMDVVRRELKAITWLGALLGAGIGCLQYFLR
jgi:uncharacterized membrane protein YheB (UPF0754 family)